MLITPLLVYAVGILFIIVGQYVRKNKGKLHLSFYLEWKRSCVPSIGHHPFSGCICFYARGPARSITSLSLPIIRLTKDSLEAV